MPSLIACEAFGLTCILTKRMEPLSPLPTMATAPPPAPVAALTETLEDLAVGVGDDEATTDPPVEAAQYDTIAASSSVPTSLIRGYLWKFPSEGSVNATDGVQSGVESYPRKCLRCGACWVSDAVNEKAHKRVCRPSAHTHKKQPDERDNTVNLGPARRVFCEVGRQAMLQVVKCQCPSPSRQCGV